MCFAFAALPDAVGKWEPAAWHLLFNAVFEFELLSSRINFCWFEFEWLGCVPFNFSGCSNSNAAWASELILLHFDIRIRIRRNFELGDFHIYEEHFEQVKIQLSREPKKLPVLKFYPKKIHEYKTSDFELINYEHHPKIVAPMNV